ncbi:MAG: NAD(P)-dependent oxidoreductase [Pseudomonadota bacterium]
MEKVFIAGGTGMLGAATARNLADHGIRSVVSSRKNVDRVADELRSYSDLIEVARIDLLNAETLSQLFRQHRFDGMVIAVHTHQYALTRDKNNEIYPIILNLLETARKAGVKRVAYGGSMASYGGLVPPYSEDAMFPAEVVAASAADEGVMIKFEVATKRALEIIALDYGQDFQMGLSVPPGTAKPEPHELEVVILRAPMMFGPGYAAVQSPLGSAIHFAAGRLPKFAGHVAYGGAPVETLWKALAPIPVSYVKDNADCLRVALTAPSLPHKIYNICSGFACSPRQQLQALLNVKPDLADKMGIVPADLPDTAPDLGFDNSRFSQDFGWASAYTLETALADYLDWLRDHTH